jgi:hypothetical protein
MSMNEQNPNTRRLQFEWYAALATIVGGFVIAIAVAAYLTYGGKAAVPTATAPQSQGSQADAQKARVAALIKLGTELCGLELANAQTFGVVPHFGKLLNPMPRTTDIRGRYVCVAGTQVTKYVLAGDLVCRNLRDSRCISLFSVTQDDGTVLYQRQS